MLVDSFLAEDWDIDGGHRELMLDDDDDEEDDDADGDGDDDDDEDDDDDDDDDDADGDGDGDGDDDDAAADDDDDADADAADIPLKCKEPLRGWIRRYFKTSQQFWRLKFHEISWNFVFETLGDGLLGGFHDVWCKLLRLDWDCGWADNVFFLRSSLPKAVWFKDVKLVVSY